MLDELYLLQSLDRGIKKEKGTPPQGELCNLCRAQHSQHEV